MQTLMIMLPHMHAHQPCTPSMWQVYSFPMGADSLTAHPQAFASLAACGLLTSFTSTLMFTTLGSFFNRISDPAMGGAYLTLLNTIANMGESCQVASEQAQVDCLRQAREVPCGGLHPAYVSSSNSFSRALLHACLL